MVSIIIPVLNEEKNIEKLLLNTQKLQGDKKIIVVDGGSVDNTVKIASEHARVISSGKGRSNQMNLGAGEASGEILWFVHADSILSPHSIMEIEAAVDNGYIGGGCSLYFHDYNTPFMKYISISSNMRAKYLGLYFGDQGIFIRKDIFEKIGGFADKKLMEDWDFSVTARKVGKMKLIKSPIGTSGRRFKEGGPLKTHLLMHKIKLLYLMGTPAEELSRIYREVR